MKVGVLALQGDVREHIQTLEKCGVDAVSVRTKTEIEDIDALVLPGGESTTIAKLARAFGVFEVISNRIKQGMPTYGSCAGMILLSNKILDAIPGQESFGGLDATVRRNAFGRQVDSFEINLDFAGINDGPVNAVFIRAPWVESVGLGVEVLAAVEAHPVAIRQGNIMATSFHPEITGDIRVHRFFVEKLCKQDERAMSTGGAK